MYLIALLLLLQLAGWAQIALALGSLTIPRVLQWRASLLTTRPLIRQMFWVYAGYIFAINLCFGLISVLLSNDLINGSILATLICGFIAVYWISRILIQFFYFDRSAFPRGGWYLAGEIVLVSLFVVLSLIYAVAFYLNLQLLKA